MAKVKFNIHNVHYAPITTVSSTGVYTYGTPVALPGAKSISLEPKDSDNEIFYADGEEYYVQSATTGYEGELEMALIDDAFRKAIYGETEDTAHDLWESTSDESKKFALGFTIDGDAGSTYFWYQKCSATKPNVEAETNGEKKSVGTDKITINCLPNNDGKIRVKSTSSSTTTNWFSTVKAAPSTN